MKRIKRFTLSLVIIFSAVAFVPVIAFPWQAGIDWKNIAIAYQHDPVIYYVTTTMDDFDINIGDGICEIDTGGCSLRAALQEAVLYGDEWGDVTIELPSGLYTLTLAYPDPPAWSSYHIAISRHSMWNVVIDGQGAENTIIEGDGTRSLFRIEHSVIFNEVTIRNGHGGMGRAGAFDIFDSALTLRNCVLMNHVGARDGGAIYNGPYSSLTLENTSVMNNTATHDGGGIANYYGNTLIRNSTISGNSAENGGGIRTLSGKLIIENSTVSNNSALYGGGINHHDGFTEIYNSTITGNSATLAAGGIGVFNPSTRVIVMSNTLLAGNINSESPDCVSTNDILEYALISLGHNLIGSTQGCSLNPVESDKVDVDPKLGPLQNNGGNTFTHTLLPGSPAINLGNPAGCLDSNNQVLTTDQRGFPRPGYTGDTRCDIGAYEWDGWTIVFLPVIVR